MTLNLSQERAVRNCGIQLVLAGPGSGKTRVITEKILHLIGSGVPPGEILALTFSDKAAREMLERLDEKTDTHELTISTFHAFCNAVLEENVLDSGISLSAGIISRANQLVWGLRNIDTFGFEYIEVGNNAAEVIESMMDGISSFRDELITADELAAYIREKQKQDLSPDEEDTIGKLGDLLKLYRHYELYKRSGMLLDFDDMIHETVRLFERKPLVLKRYKDRFRHILVDEFQDTNYAQLELVKQLAGENVCVVGDDDQTIYRFRGAYLTNVADFRQHFREAETVLLDHNYRNPATVLSLALQLMNQAPNREEKALITSNPPGAPVTVAWCENERAETGYVLKEIQQLLGSPFFSKSDKTERPYQPRDIAIICRRRADGIKFEQVLRRNGIPVEFVGEVDIFSTPAVRDVVACLKIIDNPLSAGISLNRLMKVAGIPETVVQRINARAREIRDPVDDGVFASMGEAKVIVPGHAILLQEIRGSLLGLMERKDRVMLSELVRTVMMEGTGTYARALEDEGGSSVAVLNRFLEIARDYEAITTDPTLPDFLSYLSLLSGVSLDVSGRPDRDAVRVLTAHASKGTEFPAVFLVDMVAKRFPLDYRKKPFAVPNDLSRGLKTGDDEKALFLQEERRLCYVAMTRAEERLYITLARWYGDLKTEKKPSRFLDELNFRNNPLMSVVPVDAPCEETGPELPGTADEIRWRLQEQARSAISRMQLATAIQRLVELEKVRLIGEGRSLREFAPGEFFRFNDTDAELRGLVAGERKEIVPETLRFSASSLAAYEACPLKYKFQHILLIPGPPKTYFNLGSAVHSTIEELSRQQEAGNAINKTLALDILSRFWSKNAYTSRKHEEEDLVKAGELLDTYLAWQAANPNGIAGVEQEFGFRFDDYPVKGYIDRLEETASGEILVIDFKTGKKPSEINPKSIREDVQMNLYCLGVRELFGTLPKKASLYYLKDNKMVDYVPDDQSISAFTGRMRNVISSIRGGQFAPTPGKACRGCDYQALCDAKEKELDGSL